MRLLIVIPTLDEASNLERFLPSTLGMADEVWVSDGGSQDATVAVARRLGARIVEGASGRGRQMNLGARAALTENGRADALLLFLHADTELPAEARAQIFAAVAAGAVGGAFRVRFDSARPIFRLGERIANARARLTGCALGDHALFATREAFEALGGFREQALLEDLDLARRLKKLGRTVLLDAMVTTSSRRFERHGLIRAITTNWLIFALYWLGFPPDRLARFYRRTP
jgi:rSAM/selenodomain-associated transferase 2